jgi:hypothetical protein
MFFILEPCPIGVSDTPCPICVSDIVKTMSADEVSLPKSVSEMSLPAVITSGDESDMELQDVDLPNDNEPDVESLGSDVSENGFDNVVDYVDLEAIDAQIEFDDTSPVPSPDVALCLSLQQDVAEFYSVPRVLPAARRRGLRGSLSLDLLTGWDFRFQAVRDISDRLLSALSVAILILSPPCTAFSSLQRVFNYKKLPVEVVRRKMEAAMVLLCHAIACAMLMYRAGKCFVFEHPASATSWNMPDVTAIKQLPGVFCVVFDQCMLGLRSKVGGIPMRKRTRIMTNSLHIANKFRGCVCDRTHDHQVIQGSEGGVDRSVWAQKYPGPMIDLLVQGSLEAVGHG